MTSRLMPAKRASTMRAGLSIKPEDLAVRRSGGHVAFVWYRTNLTIPAKIGDFDTDRRQGGA